MGKCLKIVRVHFRYTHCGKQNSKMIPKIPIPGCRHHVSSLLLSIGRTCEYDAYHSVDYVALYGGH